MLPLSDFDAAVGTRRCRRFEAGLTVSAPVTILLTKCKYEVSGETVSVTGSPTLAPPCRSGIDDVVVNYDRRGTAVGTAFMLAIGHEDASTYTLPSTVCLLRQLEAPPSHEGPWWIAGQRGPWYEWSWSTKAGSAGLNVIRQIGIATRHQHEIAFRVPCVSIGPVR